MDPGESVVMEFMTDCFPGCLAPAVGGCFWTLDGAPLGGAGSSTPTPSPTPEPVTSTPSPGAPGPRRRPPGVANVSVSKTPDNDIALYSWPISLTVAMTNNGPDPAEDWVMSDPLPTPAGLRSRTCPTAA